MSGGLICKCKESGEPFDVPMASNRPARLWRVLQRNGNQSAFNGYRVAWSRYSAITCLRCGRCWRTTAGYVGMLRDIRGEERFVSSGYAGHAAAMEAFGREPYDQAERHR